MPVARSSRRRAAQSAFRTYPERLSRQASSVPAQSRVTSPNRMVRWATKPIRGATRLDGGRGVGGLGGGPGACRPPRRSEFVRGRTIGPRAAPGLYRAVRRCGQASRQSSSAVRRSHSALVAVRVTAPTSPAADCRRDITNRTSCRAKLVSQPSNPRPPTRVRAPASTAVPQSLAPARKGRRAPARE